MAITSNTYTGNGSNKLFSITFPYLNASDIDVYLNGTLQTITTQYTFANATTIEFVTAPANGATVLLNRSTDDTALQATFFPGSSIKAADLNDNFDQVLYIAQETVNTVTTATTTVNAALTNSNTAVSTAAAAVSTANTASTNASAAVTTANAASTNATNAVNTANSAVTTANTANTNSNTAVTTANTAAAAVANVVLYTTVANVAAIPSSPANNTTIEVTNSTGIESFSPLSGRPVGFIGSSGLSVRIIYQTSGATWVWIQYFPNDPETRYLKLAGGTMTGALAVTAGTAALPGIAVSGDTNTGIYSPGADQLAISTGGSGRLFVDSSGRVGIGTTSPGSGLDVKNTLRLSGSTSGYVGLAPAATAGSVTYTLPSADGTSGQVLSTNGSAVLSWVNGANANYQEFTSNGTWTKPAGCSTVYVELVGGGAGGGSGARYLTTSGRSGGGGGAGGAGLWKIFRASDLTATVSVTIGAGGAGAAAITTDTTNGNNGTDGGNTQFGSYLTSDVAGGGSGGSTASVTGGTLSLRAISTVTGGSGSGGAVGTTGAGGSTAFGGGGGGSGAGRGATITTASTGGNGGQNAMLRSSSPGAAAGANATTNEGGGGGGGSYTTAVAGMNGGNGAFPGGGGGGGSASDNGFTSGAGGSGAAGLVRIWSW